MLYQLFFIETISLSHTEKYIVQLWLKFLASCLWIDVKVFIFVFNAKYLEADINKLENKLI